MARISQADLEQVKSDAIKYFGDFPVGCKLDGESTPVRERDVLAVSYIHAVLNMMNAKGLLTEEVHILLNLEAPESVWEK